MPNLKAKYKVVLSRTQRAELEALCRQQVVGARKLRRARILLLADEADPQGRRTDAYIAEVVGLSERQVVRIRQAFVREGLQPVLQRQPRADAGSRKKLDGAAEATLVTLCCSPPPQGRERWTLQLLCDELGRLKIVESVCRETVRQCLKKTNSSPGGSSGSASPKLTGRDLSPAWSTSLTSTRKRTTKRTR